MTHEPNEKEVLVEALFSAFAVEGPRDLDLFRDANSVRVTIGESRYRADVGGSVEEALDGVLSSTAESRRMHERLAAAIAEINGRRWRSAWTPA